MNKKDKKDRKGKVKDKVKHMVSEAGQILGKKFKIRKMKEPNNDHNKLKDLITEANKILGIDNDRSSKESLIKRHWELCRDISQLKEELGVLETVLHELADTYDSSKGDCFCCRYRDLEHMIEQALLRYAGGSLPRDVSRDESHDERRPLVGPGSITGLRQACQQFAHNQRVELNQKADYNKMTEGQLEEAILQLTKEHTELTVMQRTEKQKLNRLSSKYRNSQAVCCLWRYGKLKKMITEAIADYHDTPGYSIDV